MDLSRDRLGRRHVPADGDPADSPRTSSRSSRAAGGNTIYNATFVADAPVGFALAINGSDWLAATRANQLLALDALAQIQNPTLNDAVNTQCLACHVATYLTTARAASLGVDPTTSPSWYHTERNVTVSSLANMDPRVVRAFGWVNSSPVISQGVANDTAHALDDVEALFPAQLDP